MKLTETGRPITPNRIAVSSGSIYVAEHWGSGFVEKYSWNGTKVAEFGNFGNSAGGIAVDSQGNVYVTDIAGHQVQKFSSNGTLLTQFGSFGTGDGQFNYPLGLTVDGAGFVYVCDSLNNRVEKFSSDGTYIAQFGTSGSGNGQFNNPPMLPLTPSGTYMYLTPEIIVLRNFLPQQQCRRNQAVEPQLI